MGTMIGKICFIYYKHIISGVVKNKEYFLENVTNLGLPLPLMKPDFPTLTSPMFMVAGDWSTPTAAIAALQLKADGTLSWVSSHGHTEPLERLKKLFLFEDDAMSEKEYLMSKRELEGTLSDIENELSALEADTADTKYDDMSFISTASGFLIAHQIASGEHINYRELACAVDAKVLKDFANSVIERIVLLDGRVASIEFKNGLVHEFLYRE